MSVFLCRMQLPGELLVQTLMLCNMGNLAVEHMSMNYFIFFNFEYHFFLYVSLILDDIVLFFIRIVVD